MNRREFQDLAKKFRGGRVGLSELTDAVFPVVSTALNESGFENDPVKLRLPVRPENSHKGDFGRVLLVGGSESMPGAIALSGLASLRAGAGLVTIITTAEASSIVSSFSPCLMTTGLAAVDGVFSDADDAEIMQRCQSADVVAIGPGMGRNVACQKIVSNVYADVECPVIVDADGINNLVDAGIDWTQHAGERVLTPHPGEYSRIAGESLLRRSEMESHATEMARRTQMTIVLKGHRSHVTNGDRNYRNESGNAGMSTAGSGDVLTGIVAALIGQKMDVFESAAIASFLHGMSGDLYAESANSASLIATDLIDWLPRAMNKLSAQNQGS